MTFQELVDIRESLVKKIAEGQKLVQAPTGARVEYQDTDKLILALANVDAELASRLQGNAPGSLDNFNSRISFGVRA